MITEFVDIHIAVLWWPIQLPCSIYDKLIYL